MKKYKSKLLVGLLIPILIFAIPIANNIRLAVFSHKLMHYDAGKEYKIVAIDSICQLLKSGNGMDYFNAQLVYCQDTISSTNMDTIIVDANNEWFWHDYGPYCKNIKSAVDKLDNKMNYYIIYTIHSASRGSLWELDLRAH